MKRAVLFIFLSGLLLLATSALAMAEEGAMDELVQTPEVNSGGPQAGLEAPVIPKYIDERILAVEKDARDRINVIVEEINALTDRSKEPELQKQIVKIEVEIAEEEGSMDIAQKFRDEIYHLENLDNPVVGYPEEQPIL